MSYIIKSTSPFVSIKLTQKGREKLAQGKLNFSHWAIGDSELNYEREGIVDSNINDATLSGSSAISRPVDRQPNIKYFISQNNGTPFQPIDTSVLNVVKAIVNNEATERGFFESSGNTFTTLTSTTLTNYNEVISNTVLTGGTELTLTSTTSVSIGDLMLLKLANQTIGSITPFENTNALPNVWFKVEAISGTTLYLDRNLPNMSADSASSQVIFYPSGEVYDTIGESTNTAYWDSGTLSFNSNVNITCHDVPVWNMNNVWCENLAGITGLTTTNLYEDYKKFGSYNYLGVKYPYFGYLCESTGNTLTFSCNGTGLSYLDDVTKSISILHYTNNTISNLYGEFFYTDTENGKYLSIDLPDLMYHRKAGSTASGTTMGMRFVATGTTMMFENTDMEYLNLYEDASLLPTGVAPKIIGKVLPQLKEVIITDDEIVAATSYKSNRNWTLPELAANLQNPSGGTSNGVLEINQTMYLTYMLENTIDGLTTALPCQTYIKITNDTSSSKDVAFRINETDMLAYMRKIESIDYDGYGFYADKFKLVYQIVQDPIDRPNPGLWKTVDFTSTLITENVGETINPKLLENQSPSSIGFVLTKTLDTSALDFSIIETLNLPPNTSPEKLQFGDERFFYGNLKTHIGATIYKTIFDIRVNASQFNTTTNPTRSTDILSNQPNIKVSEVGVYDSDKNLVCIGKLSSPVSLSGGNIIMFELSMDF
jgi:hypothetical protein